MAETTIEKVDCAVCGAEIREGSLFCYNCGTAVVKEVPSVGPPSDDVPAEETSSNNVTSVETQSTTRPPLRSAASLRKRSQALRRQPVEVSWEPAGDSSRAFIAATVFVALVALILFLIAMYLR